MTTREQAIIEVKSIEYKKAIEHIEDVCNQHAFDFDRQRFLIKTICENVLKENEL